MLIRGGGPPCQPPKGKYTVRPAGLSLQPQCTTSATVCVSLMLVGVQIRIKWWLDCFLSFLDPNLEGGP